MPAARVYVMAKAPVAGLVKTRICPPLAPGRAAELAVAFAADVLRMLAAAGGLDVRLALDRVGSGEKARAAAAILEGLATGLGLPVEDQGEGDLGARMDRLVRRGLADGLPTILVGADTPDLPRDTVLAAARALAGRDAVLAPAADGGYVLVGASRAIDGLFRIDAAWSSERVFVATCEALAREGCAFDVLAGAEDVDDAAALGRLADRLAAGGALVAPSTAALLGTWRTEGVRF
jgi:hypothetical protein